MLRGRIPFPHQGSHDIARVIRTLKTHGCQFGPDRGQIAQVLLELANMMGNPRRLIGCESGINIGWRAAIGR